MYNRVTYVRHSRLAVAGAIALMREGNLAPGQELAGDSNAGWLAAIVQSSPEAIIGEDLNGFIRSWNDSAEALYGYPAGEVLNRRASILLPPDRLQEECFIRQEMLDGKKLERFETIRLRRDGQPISVVLTVSPVLNATGDFVGIAYLARPVSASASNERSLAQLAAIIESSEDAIVSKSLEGIIQSWNAGAEQIYGYAPEEVIGESMMSLLPKSLIEQEIELLNKMQKGEHVKHFETVRIHKEGRPVPVSLTLSPIRNASGHVIGVSHIARDITESQELKDRLQLSKRMEAVGRLAGGIAHDFNNLLTVITGYGALLQNSLKEDPERKDMVDEIVAASQKSTDLTRQLLAFSRGQPLHLQPVDLNDALLKMQGMLRRLVGEDIELKMHLENGLRHIQADPGQISQIVMNLAANARDAMPGGGTIGIQTSNWEIRDDLFHEQLGFVPGYYVRLIFSDTGNGMSAETCNHVFEPFFTTKEFGKGTGLGLSTVYGIVKHTGGQISVYSELGVGTTFSIYLPCSDCKPAGKEESAVKLTQGSETVLLVEDEPSLRKLAQSVLKASGYQVLVSSNANEALEQAQNYAGEIRLMLTDIVMPGMNGERLAYEMSKLRPFMRPVFMSGYSEHAVLQSILSEPDAAFLQKPFTPSQLLQKIREVLDR